MSAAAEDLEIYRMDRGANRHHAFWPKPNYPTATRKLFRELACSIVRDADYMVHRMHHLHFPVPQPPSLRAMEEALRRHRQGKCGCRDKQLALVRFNLLQLPADHPMYQWDCTWGHLDPYFYELLQSSLAGQRSLEPAWLAWLQARHQDFEDCTCHHSPSLSRPMLTLVGAGS